jgi:hypothetical protein
MTTERVPNCVPVLPHDALQAAYAQLDILQSCASCKQFGPVHETDVSDEEDDAFKEDFLFANHIIITTKKRTIKAVTNSVIDIIGIKDSPYCSARNQR